MQISSFPRRKPATGPLGWRKFVKPALAALALAVGGSTLAVAGCGEVLDRHAPRFFASPGGGRDIAALYMSGDMGLRWGMGWHVAPALARRGVPVMGVSSSELFARRRTRAEVDAIVADAMRRTLAKTSADRVVLIGQSFGADMIATALPSLPADLRPKVAAAVLVVPGRDAYFRADPLGFAYRGEPDARPGPALRAVGWTPVLCIRGAEETDSLCPELQGASARLVVLPGGHFLEQDYDLLVGTIMSQLRTMGVVSGA